MQNAKARACLTFTFHWRRRQGLRSRNSTLQLKYANRHGLIAGATGTGKTVTLQILAEGFSRGRRAGLPLGREGRSLGPRPGRLAST